MSKVWVIITVISFFLKLVTHKIRKKGKARTQKSKIAAVLLA